MGPSTYLGFEPRLPTLNCGKVREVVEKHLRDLDSSVVQHKIWCEGGVDVVGVLTPRVRGGAQVLHGDQVVELSAARSA